MPSLRRIALLMGQDFAFSRHVLRGIRAYALRHPNWAFRSGPPQADTIDSLRQWKPDGIIAEVVDADFAKSLLRLKRPVVDTFYWIEHAKLPVVDVDHAEVGRMAAEYLASLGLRHFAFFGNEAVYSGLREKAFAKRLAAMGYRAEIYRGEPLRRMAAQASSDWKKRDALTRKWLERLPKPVGVFACNDATARILADLCSQSDFRIPEEVALLGVDDDELECLLTSPPLSSIAIPSERIGYEAAKLLDERMDSSGATVRRVFLPPMHVVARQSTDTMNTNDPVVIAALRYIQAHVGEGVNVSDVVHSLGAGRRELERKFRAVLGRSVLEEIRQMRLKQSQKLLAGTDLPMSEVAKLSGFSNAHRFAIVFHRFCGMPPTAYRRQSQIRDA
jgi:LacI family transcriptional regulator